MEKILQILSKWTPPGGPVSMPSNPFYIEDFELTTGITLPGAYRAFLDAMGDGTGSLQIDQGDFRLRGVFESYEVAPWKPPSRLVYIGADLNPIAPRSFFLDRTRPLGDDDLAVVRLPYEALDGRWEAELTVDFASFREMLMYWAIRSIRLPCLPHRATLQYRDPDEDRVDLGEKVINAAEHMFRNRLPHMEACRGYDSENGAILVERDAVVRKFRVVRMGSRDAREHRQRIAVLEDLGLKSVSR